MIKRILLLVVGVGVVAGVVFGGLMLLMERLDYGGASAYVGDMLAAEGAVIDLLSADMEELDEDVRGLVLTNFDETVGRIVEYYRSLGASSALKNEAVKMKYDELSEMMGSLEQMQVMARWLVDFLEVMEAEGYAKAVSKAQAEVPNDFAKRMVTDMAEYLERAAEFAEKYGGGTASNYDAMTEEYGLILAEGEELMQKYRAIDLTDVVGVSVDEVRDWFGKLRELRELLESKK